MLCGVARRSLAGRSLRDMVGMVGISTRQPRGIVGISTRRGMVGSSRRDPAKLNLNPAELRATATALQLQSAFKRWRREHTVMLVSSGIMLGATIFGGALYLYLDRYPSAIEFFVVEKTVRAFDASLSFESRMKVYLGLPEPNIPNFEALFMRAVEEALQQQEPCPPGEVRAPSAEDVEVRAPSAEDILFGWADQVDSVLNKLESTWMLQAKTVMRDRLLEETSALPGIDERLAAVWEILPASVERNLQVSAQLDAYLAEGKLISGATIERLRPQVPEHTCDVTTAVLIHAVAFFPGPINKLVHFLDQPAPRSDDEAWLVVEEIVADLNSAVAEQDASGASGRSRGSATTLVRRTSRRMLERTGLVRSTLEKTLLRLKTHFDKLPEAMQSHVLTTALRTTITMLPQLPRVGGVRPFDLYVRAIEDDLVGPLRRDARITEDILQEVKHIFLAMPGNLQARVLLTAMRHPLAQQPAADAGRDAQAELARDLLSSGGVVAVKLAQMLAEHPKVPQDYQQMLGSLRDDNEPMPITRFWWKIPSAVRSSIDALGPCLGTGSVKQANLARFRGDQSSNVGDKEKEEEEEEEEEGKGEEGEEGELQAVVVLRAEVEDEALSSISALETSRELGPVATRLGRLVYGEFNLHMEGEVLEEFARTQIGQHPLFHVVRVRHHSPKCLVEEIAQGESVAAALERSVASDEDRRRKDDVFRVLVEYHRTVMSAFVNDGVIHSDFERIGLPDTKALLWTLAALSDEEHRVTIKKVCLAHLASTSTLKDKSVRARKGEKVERKELVERLSRAFANAIKPNEDGEVPDKRTAYILLLRNAEQEGVNVPKGAFAVAKMIDGIVSQQERYDLPNVVDDCIEAFLRSHMTWGELADIGARSFKIL